MKDFLIFALLVSITLAEPGWNPASVYIYSIHSQSYSMIDMQSNVYQGVAVKGILHLKTGLLPPWTLNGQITDLKYAEFNNTPLTECLPPADNISWKNINISNSTFAIKLNEGVVEKIMLKENIINWEANFIRSVVTQLQINLQGRNKIELLQSNNQHQSEESIKLFSTMEESVIGHCETRYDITPLSEHVIKNKPELAPLLNTSEENIENLLDIAKTHNFSNCKQHILFHKGMNSQQNWDAGLPSLGDALERTTTARIILNGTFDNYTMQSSVAIDKMLISPSLYKEEKALIEHCMNLTLKEVKRSVTTPVLLNGTQSNLLYDYQYKTIENIDITSRPDNYKKDLSDAESQLQNTQRVHFQKSILQQKMFSNRHVRSAGTPAPDTNLATSTEPTIDSSTSNSTITPENSTIDMKNIISSTIPYIVNTSPATDNNYTDKTTAIETTTIEALMNETSTRETTSAEILKVETSTIGALVTDASTTVTSTNEKSKNKSSMIDKSTINDSMNELLTSSTEVNNSNETYDSMPDEKDEINQNTNSNKINVQINDSIKSVRQLLNMSKSLEHPRFSSLLTNYPSLAGRTLLSEELQKSIQIISENIGAQLIDFQSIINANSLYNFSELTTLIAIAEYEVLHNISNKMYEPLDSRNSERRMSWIVFRDAVAQSGTGPALMLIKEWILYNKITNDEAGEILGTLPSSVVIPNEEYLDALFDLVKHPQISKEENLNVTTLLSFTKIVNKVFVDTHLQKSLYPVHIFSPLVQNITKLKKNYLPYLESKLNGAILKNDSQRINTYVRGLGYVAHPEVLNIFAKYLKQGTNITSFTKKWMVICLDKMTELQPSETRNFLYSLYIDGNENAEVRTAAVFQIMKSKPPANMLQRIAELSKYDNSNQVIAAVQSSIQSATLLSGVGNLEFKEAAKRAKTLLSDKNLGIQYSHLSLKEQEYPQLGKLGLRSSVNYFGSKNHIIPNGLFFDYERDLGGLKSEKEYYGLLIPDVKKVNNIFDKLWDITKTRNDKEMPKKQSTTESSGSKSPKNTNESQTNHEEQLEAILLYQMARYEKFLTLDKDMTKYLKDILKNLKSGYKVNYTKLFHRDTFTLAVPNLAGHITRVTYNVPSIYQVMGKVKLNMKQTQNSENYYDANDDISFSGQLNFGYSFNKYTDISFITPFNGNRYISGYKEQLLFNIPMKTNITSLSRGPWKESQIIFSPYSNALSEIYCQFNSEKYKQNDNILDIIKKKNIGMQHTIQAQPYKQIITNYGSMQLTINTELTSLANIKTPVNDNHNFFSIINFPASINYIQNNNITLVIGFPIGMNSISLRMRHANLNMEEQEIKLRSKRHKEGKSQHNSQSGNNTAISEWSLLLNQNKKTVFTTTMRYSCSPFSNKTNLQISLNQNSQEQMKLVLDGYWAKISIFNTSKDLTANPKSEINALLYLDSSKSPTSQMKCKLQRTSQRKEHLMKQPETEACMEQMLHGNYILPSCQVTSEEANYLDQYNCSISVEGLNDKIKLFKNSFKYFYTLMYNNITYKARKEPGPSNTIAFKTQFNPSFQSADLFISLPNTDAILKNISIPSPLAPIVKIHPAHSVGTRIVQKIMSQQYIPTCVVDKTKINTFDNRTYPVNFGPCWYVLMVLSLEGSVKPILHENDILILVRDNNEGRVVRLLIGEDMVDITNHQSSKHSSNKYLHVNNVQHQIFQGKYTNILQKSENNIILQSTVTDDKIKLDLTNQSTEILFDGIRVMIRTSNKYRNQTLGLCGTFNGEDFDDFAVPNKNCKLSDPALFTASYAVVNNNTCPKEVLQMAQRAINMTCSATNELQVETKFSEVVPCAEDKNRESDPRCMTNFIQVVQDHKNTCFSQKRIPSCKASCHPIKIVQKKVSFHCVSTNAVSPQFVQAIISGRLHDFSEKRKSKMINVDVPSGCYKC